MNIQELQAAIQQLSPNEFAWLVQWFDEYRAEQWDRQIEADIRAGRLDEANRRADEDFEAGRARLVRDVQEARAEFSDGRIKPASVTDIMDDARGET